MENLKVILAIGIGGALGTLFRYFLNVSTFYIGYPIGTLLENIVGSFLLGAFTGCFLFIKVPNWVKAGLGVGLCGGFTTMSTLAADTVFFLQSGNSYSVPIYLLTSIFGGLGFAFLGLMLGQKIGKRKEVLNSN